MQYDLLLCFIYLYFQLETLNISKFRRVNEIFDFTFKIPAHRAFKKLLDIQMIYEQMQCAKHLAILNRCIFVQSVPEYLNIRNQIHCALQEMVIYCKYDLDNNIFTILYVNFRAIKIINYLFKDPPFSTSFSILYFSVIVLVFSFLLQPATFDILAYKTKQQSFRRPYLFNFRTFEVSNHTNTR